MYVLLNEYSNVNEIINQIAASTQLYSSPKYCEYSHSE